MNRRQFLCTGSGATLCAVWPAAVCGAQETAERQVTAHILPANPPVTFAADFLGLGYEMSSVAPLGLLSADNAPYVRLVQQLGPTGVLRFGGIVADYTSYQREGPIAASPKHTVFSEASLRQVRGFLDRTGWRAIWSVNFGRGTLPEAVEEARAVASILGDRLLALELGNEVENYGQGSAPLRPPPYTYETFRREYAAWHQAVAAAAPRVPFAAPDTAGSVTWVENMARDAAGTVQLLTTHYYRNSQQHGSAAQLEEPDPALLERLRRLQAASRSSGTAWRMCETSSFSGGGLPGVSDAIPGALWTLDYLFLLASYGCAGVNIETGVNQLGFISSYSPIRDDGQGHTVAGAPYYALLAFRAARRTGYELLPVTLETAPPGLTAYGLGRGGGRLTALVVINRQPGEAVTVRLDALPLGEADVLRLSASDPASREVRFAGAAVEANGSWSPAHRERLGAGSPLRLPPRSAAVLLRPSGA